MSRASDLVHARLPRAEGDRNDAYDDATGKTVHSVSPDGHITWGRGFNLSAIASPALFDVIEAHLIGAVEASLLKLDWYVGADSVRRSVFLEVAYNNGLTGLLHGFPKMIRYAGLKDWENCANECTVSRPDLNASRYAPLRALIRNGDTST